MRAVGQNASRREGPEKLCGLTRYVDDYALPAPSSRAKLVFGPSRDGAKSACDLILDLSGGTPLFPAHELRPGYVRADPRDRAEYNLSR